MNTTSDYIPRREADLLLWIRTFINVANANIAQTGLESAQIDALDDLASAYSLAFVNRLTSAAAAKSSTLEKVRTRGAAMQVARRLAMIVQKHPGATVQLKTKLRLNAERAPRLPVLPQVPTDLSATVGPQGQISLKWDRAGNKKRTNFVLEVREGTGGPWVFLAAVTRTRYIDYGRKPGEFIQYRVHAVRPTTASLYGDIASVYSPEGQASGKRLAA